MNRNSQAHFANLPGIKIGRSKFDRSFTHKCTFNAGDLIPIYLDCDIVPGDSVTMRMSEVVRMMTPLTPVMDNCWLDVYFFFVPNRLVMTDWKKLMGENETAPWTQTIDIQIPQVEFNNGNRNGDTEKLNQTPLIGSLAEKMGIPPVDWTYANPKTKSIKISALPFRGYCTIWNEFFRDENLQNPVYVPKGNTDVVSVNINAASYISDPDSSTTSNEYKGGLPPLKVCKPFDYFTSCLPQPQKGTAVTIPLTNENPPVRIGKILDTSGQDYEWKDVKDTSDNVLTGKAIASNVGGFGAFEKDPYEAQTQVPTAITQGQDYMSLYTDLSAVTGATITQLRQAFAVQKFFERDARSGTRYIESIKAHFSVQNPDYRLQRPEYLGGFRHPISINQVVQSTPTENDSTPLGTTGAYSITANTDKDMFTKSFTEHGMIIGLACVRTSHTYQQGINRMWFKKKRLDFYSPEFANLSEQPVYLKELYSQGTDDDEKAFGYQECWAEMRYMPDMITGELRSQYSQSLDIWHYGDYYESKPELGDKWIQETKNNIQRTLAVQDHDQFMADFYFGAIYTRPMPLYSVPGLIDHH